MIPAVFLACALAVPVAAPRYSIPIGHEEVSVLKVLGEMSDYRSSHHPILYFGPDPSWVKLLREEKLPAFGLINFKMDWPYFTIGLTHLLPFKDESINLFIFMNHFPNFEEMNRVIKNNGFLIFDPVENPILKLACESMKWRLRFSIHHYAVYQKKESFAFRASESAKAKINAAVDQFNWLSPPYAIHRRRLWAARQILSAA
jgi:hypothetical protein